MAYRQEHLRPAERTSVTFLAGILSLLNAVSAPATAVVLLCPAIMLVASGALVVLVHDSFAQSCAVATAVLAALFALGTIVNPGCRVKNVDVLEDGLLLSTDEAGEEFFVLPWEYIVEVGTAGYRNWNLQGRSLYLKTSVRSHYGTLYLKHYISWSDVTRSLDIGQFLSAVRTFAPHADLTSELKELVRRPEAAISYTELWLRELSQKPRRHRLSSLAAETKLARGRYTIAGRLAIGGQGTAYLAHDGDRQRDVVLKEYVLPVYGSEEYLKLAEEKLKKEADILRSLKHPQIVKLLDFFVEDFRGYLVLEYVEGLNLRSLVEREGPQPEIYVLKLAEQMCEVITYLHSMSPPVVHRDLTPENMILQPDGTLKLVDFNVAQQLTASTTATIVGKHAFIAPEQFRGRPVPASDVYSLGCTLHYLLTGVDPEPITSCNVHDHNPRVSISTKEAIARATAQDAGERIRSACELLQALKRSASHQAKTATTHSDCGSV